MSENQPEHPRNAGKIMDYCEKRDAQSYLQFDMFAHEDLPAVTKAAVELRKALFELHKQAIAHHGGRHVSGCSACRAIRNAAAKIVGTAWLGEDGE